MDNDRPLTAIPLKIVTKVPVQWLTLDRLNPRLFLSGGEPKEVEIIERLYRSEDLSELLQSIAANGYLDIEPLVVLKEEENLTVLEGNRRLAAIRLFEEPDLPVQIRRQTGLRVTIPSLPEEFRSTLQEVSVYRVESREDARAFIGFKHINGAARWESYAKAKYAADWYKKGGTSLEVIATQIGDRHDTIKRMVNAIYVLEQAERAEIFHLSDRVSPRFNFSHLYTALSRATYMRFLGLKEAWTQFHPEPDPVPPEKLESLGEVLRWLYGSKGEGIDPVIHSQNPDIRLLGEVLESPEGISVLRVTRSLTEAHLSTTPANQRFLESLVRARREVREASNNLRGFDGQDQALVGIAEDISETAQAMLARMVRKVKDVEAEEE
ncbi:MAG: ParB N-terminal domain-containing protein [Candidatus Poribacteria bacterium]|nr:ParB N-terminal domain-containing protein [Candidatus Poribacteria bacterium]